MLVDTPAVREPLSKPISFRLVRTRAEMLEAFRRADGLPNLTPILREAVDVYIDERLRRSRRTQGNDE